MTFGTRKENYTEEEIHALIEELYNKYDIILKASDIWLLIKNNDELDEDEWFDIVDWMSEFYVKKGLCLWEEGTWISREEYLEIMKEIHSK